MTCFHPLKGFRARSVSKSGKRPITFVRSEAFSDLVVEVPCGQCTGCRLEKARQWALRCLHEAQLYENNCFITLTYNNFGLPEHGSLCKRDLQLFMKRLRKRFGVGIRFYGCGEYGDLNGRPHYHVLLFNHDFKDRVYMFTNAQGDKVYASAALAELWCRDEISLGQSSVGDVSFRSAGYCARYVMKKVTGLAAEDAYDVVDCDGVVVGRREPEFAVMSRRGGIGKDWLKEFGSDVLPRDYVVVSGRRVGVPLFYDRIKEVEDAIMMKAVKRKRKRALRKHVENNTPERLRVREKVLNSRLTMLKRDL